MRTKNKNSWDASKGCGEQKLGPGCGSVGAVQRGRSWVNIPKTLNRARTVHTPCVNSPLNWAQWLHQSLWLPNPCLLRVPIVGESIWLHHPRRLTVLMVGRNQYCYITAGFSGSPWWGEINMATSPLPSRGPQGGEKSIWLHHPCLHRVPVAGRNQYACIAHPINSIGGMWFVDFWNPKYAAHIFKVTMADDMLGNMVWISPLALGTSADVLIWDVYGPSRTRGDFFDFEVGGHDLRRPHWLVDLTAKTHNLCRSQCPFFTPQKSIPLFHQNRLAFFVCSPKKIRFLPPRG